MYELALAQNIIELLEEQAVNHQFSKVKRSLEIGVMACVEVPARRPRMSPLVIPFADNAFPHYYRTGARLVSVL